MLQIASINSGSNGNCYYVGNDNEAVLIDAGISCRETDKRMLRMGLSMEKVNALFVSHEHSDHIKGVQTLSKKYQLPIYITEETYISSKLRIDSALVCLFEDNKKINIGSLTVHPFRKYHDAVDPYSFTVSGNGINIGVYTDLGRACERLTAHFSNCHAAFLEANYDVKMLHEGNYPYYLKQRISSGEGHLSNHEALEVFNNYRSSQLQLLLLSHLSKKNNSPELVRELFSAQAGNTTVVVASRYEESGVYHIAADGLTNNSSKKEIKQMTLF